MHPIEFYFPDPAGRVPASALQVNGGTSACVALPVLGRGVLTKLIVAQIAGASEGFSYALYNSKLAYPPGVGPGAGALEPLFRVAGPMTVAAGDIMFDGGEGWINDGVSNLSTPYHNLDGDPSNIPNLLYLYISAAGSGAKSFGVALTACNPFA